MLKSRLLSMVNPQIFFRWFFLNDYNVTCKVAKVIHITKSHNMIFFWIQHQEVMTKPLFIVRNSIWRLSMTLPKVFSQGNCPLLLAKLLNVEFLAKNLFYKNVKNCESGREGGGGGGRLPVEIYCRPPSLADEENFSFQIVQNG